MAYFRANSPRNSVAPKMHMLEDHVIPFLKKLRYALGFYGEQGGESLHHEFKAMKNRYKNIRKPVECLTYMMNQHLSNLNPESQTLRPEASQRNLKRKHEE